MWDTVAPVHLTAVLRAGRINCHLDIDVPKEGRPTTRVRPCYEMTGLVYGVAFGQE